MKSFNQACLNKVCGLNENEFPSVDMVAVVILFLVHPVQSMFFSFFSVFSFFSPLFSFKLCVYISKKLSGLPKLFFFDLTNSGLISPFV